MPSIKVNLRKNAMYAGRGPRVRIVKTSRYDGKPVVTSVFTDLFEVTEEIDAEFQRAFDAQQRYLKKLS